MKTFYSGQSILEVILATTLIAIGMVAALALTTNSQKSTTFSKNFNLASNFSYQAADWARNLRSYLGWKNFTYYLSQDASGNSVTYCLNSSLPDNETAFANLENGSCDSGDTIPETIFSRTITFDLSSLGSNVVTGHIETSWVANITHSHSLDLELTEW